MSPEQHRRQTPDARSDQFNFCASLYWAIYGTSPLEGLERMYLRRHQQPTDDDHTSTVDTAGGAVDDDGPTLVKEFPKEPRLPASVRRTLVRGLSLDPEQRFSTMEELLKQLSYDPRVAQRRWAIGAVGALVISGAAFGYQRAINRHSQVCRGAETRLEKVWNPDLQGQMERSFAGSGSPYATLLLPQVQDALDDYGKSWMAMHTDACEATRLRGEQTDEVLSLRMICLDRRLLAMGALTRILVGADDKVVEKSLDAANQLPGLTGCADVAALKSPIPLPEDQATRTRVDEIARKLAESKALADSGNVSKALQVGEAVTQALETVSYAPIRAEVLSHFGWLLRSVDAKQAEKQLEEAVVAGEEGRLDTERARAQARLVYVVGYAQGRYEDAARWKRLAEAAVRRAPSSEVEIDLLNYWGNVLLKQQRYVEAATALERGARVAEQEFGELDTRTNVVLSNWASAVRFRKPEEALKLITRSIVAYEKTRGPTHPTVGRQRRVLAQVYLELNDYRHAYDELKKAEEIHSASVGPESQDVAYDLDWLAITLQADGLSGEALQVAERSLQIREKVMPPNSSDLAYSLENIGQAYLGLRKPQEAVTALERALQIHDKNRHDLGDTAEARFALARALWEGGRDRKRAGALAEQARQGYEHNKDEKHLAVVKKWQQDHPVALPPKGGSRR